MMSTRYGVLGNIGVVLVDKSNTNRGTSVLLIAGAWNICFMSATSADCLRESRNKISFGALGEMISRFTNRIVIKWFAISSLQCTNLLRYLMHWSNSRLLFSRIITCSSMWRSSESQESNFETCSSQQPKTWKYVI